MLQNHPPKGPRIRSAERFALVEHGGVAVEQGRVNYVRVADDPTDIRCRPIHFARFHTIDVSHTPFERDEMAAIVANDPFGHASGTRGIENIERVSGCNGNTTDRFRISHLLRPIEITAADHGCSFLWALDNDAMLGFH